MKLTADQAIKGQVELVLSDIENAKDDIEAGALEDAAYLLSRAAMSLAMGEVIRDIRDGALKLVETEEDSDGLSEVLLFPAYKAEFMPRDGDDWLESSLSPAHVLIEEDEFVIGARFPNDQVRAIPAYDGQRIKLTPEADGPSYVLRAHPSEDEWVVTAVIYPAAVQA